MAWSRKYILSSNEISKSYINKHGSVYKNALFENTSKNIVIFLGKNKENNFADFLKKDL